jgi:hypothetical protein
MTRTALIALALTASTPALAGPLTVAPHLASHMVLQQGKPAQFRGGGATAGGRGHRQLRCGHRARARRCAGQLAGHPAHPAPRPERDGHDPRGQRRVAAAGRCRHRRCLAVLGPVEHGPAGVGQRQSRPDRPRERGAADPVAQAQAHGRGEACTRYRAGARLVAGGARQSWHFFRRVLAYGARNPAQRSQDPARPDPRRLGRIDDRGLDVPCSAAHRRRIARATHAGSTAMPRTRRRRWRPQWTRPIAGRNRSIPGSAAAAWAAPGLDDGGWEKIAVPGQWERSGRRGPRRL